MGSDAREALSSDRLRVLLLEDSHIDAELTMASLDAGLPGVQYLRVRNRQEFLDGLAGQPVDLILADYALPDFDGLAALDHAIKTCRDVPFIFVSGVMGEEFAIEALKRGATDYVLKRNLMRLPAAVQRAMAVSRERTRRKLLERALQRSELSTRLAVRAAKLGLWEYEPSSDTFVWDSRSRAMLGLRPDSAVSLSSFDGICHPDDAPRIVASIRRATAERRGDDVEEEFRAHTRDGVERWFAARGTLVPDDGGVRLTGVIREITDERRARAALTSLNEMLEALVDERTRERDRIWRLSQDVLASATLDGVLLSANPALNRLLGWEEKTALGVNIADLCHDEDRDEWDAHFGKLRSGSPLVRFECRMCHKDNGCRWFFWTAACDGETVYLFGRDINPEREALSELAAANRQLMAQIEERERVEATLRQMQRLEAIGQLTSGVAHDFNNLLTVVLGNIAFIDQALGRAGVDDKSRQRLTLMKSAAERGAKLTAQLLAFSRSQHLDSKPIDLNSVIKDMRELLSTTMGGAIAVETELQEDLWPALVDPTQIELAILNLAINARDAMQGVGSVRISTRNVTVQHSGSAEEPMPGDYVCVSVADSGHGMSDEVVAKAFEPFFTTKDIGKGSGLGLSQVLGFAKQSGGGVRIESAVGLGTSVLIYLPRTYDIAVALSATADQPEADAFEPGEIAVLVVDDNGPVREVTASVLREIGCRVYEAGSGGAAIDTLGREPIDIAVIDFAMPGMNGAEVARVARERKPGMPILFVTGHADKSALDGVSDEHIIRKPYAEGELAEKIRRAVSRGPRRRSLSPRSRHDRGQWGR